MSDKVKTYVYTVVRVAWLLISILLWSVFLAQFLHDTSFIMWMVWGFVCTILMIPTAAKFIWASTKEGYKEGTHSYKANLFANVYGGIGVNISDRRYSQAIITLVMSVVVFLAVGPIIVPIKIIISIIELIPLIKILSKDKVFTVKALKITGIIIGLILLVIALVLLFKSCTALDGNYEIVSEKFYAGYELKVCRSGSESELEKDEYTWSVSDENVATISSGGILTFNQGGYVVVRATSNDDEEDFVETSFFQPYDVVADSGTKNVIHLNSTDENVFWQTLKVVAEDAYNILCATRADKLFDVIEGLAGMFITFGDDDAYLFSSAIGKYRIKNELLYVVSDWTNEDVDVSSKLITQEQLSAVVCKPYNQDYQDGVSISDFGVNTINNFIDRKTPVDGIYRFSEMDDNYEYRVVVRGDFDYGTSSHYYRHGLLSGLFNAIKDMVTSDWDEISDEWLEIRDYNEISNLSNLNIYIEYRAK